MAMSASCRIRCPARRKESAAASCPIVSRRRSTARWPSRARRRVWTNNGTAMTAERVQDAPPFAGHSPEQYRPLGGYGLLTAVYGGLCAAFGAWFVRSGRDIPERIAARDLAIGAVA